MGDTAIQGQILTADLPGHMHVAVVEGGAGFLTKYP